MPQFVTNQTLETTEPEIEVTVNPQAPLPVGRQRFQLVVVDDGGNVSEPDVAEVIVKDTSRPTAVLQAPREVHFGQSFFALRKTIIRYWRKNRKISLDAFTTGLREAPSPANPSNALSNFARTIDVQFAVKSL